MHSLVVEGSGKMLHLGVNELMNFFLMLQAMSSFLNLECNPTDLEIFMYLLVFPQKM